MTSLTRSECRSQGYASSQITDSMMCATDPGKDACQGDSGGPLVTKATGVDNGYSLIGVVSFGSESLTL